MKIHSVFDPEFHSYGQIVTGLEDTVQQILAVLKDTPLPEGVGYVPTEPALQQLPAAQIISDHCYGGMPVELGWCNGHNTRLNCLEYHRDSEFSVGTEDYILLLGRQEQIENGLFDTAKTMAFRVPAGVLVETYATTLHFAPCHSDPSKGFRVMIALPWLTNTDRPNSPVKTAEDAYLTARNKWLLAHPESAEAKSGAKIGLRGENIDIADSI